LFSRIVVLKTLLPNVIAITAMGIEAETVRPAFKARYTVAAPKRMPKILPSTSAFTVNSFMFVSGETNGLKLGKSGIAVSFIAEDRENPSTINSSTLNLC
jgi:hypothetical protein